MRRFPVFFTVGVVLAVGSAGAQQRVARPDLNGVWKVNVAGSEFGQVPPPEKQSETVTQAGEEMAIAVKIRRTIMARLLSSDGEATVQSARRVPLRFAAKPTWLASAAPPAD